MRRWVLKSPSPPVYEDSILLNDTAFINSIAFIPPSADYPEGLAVSGGKEAIIQVRNPERPPESDPERMLLGHQSNVCALDTCADPKKPYVVSGSWDSSAMLWDVDKGESTATLEGHSGSVWAVLAYDHERVITGKFPDSTTVLSPLTMVCDLGCADHLLRVFSTGGKLLSTIKGSADVVRALCKLPASSKPRADFASAGNDAVIRLWTLEGKEVAQLHGHENFIYALACLPTGELVSSGEDRTVRIWRESACIQTITHPAISVWTVAASPETGDIMTGASDRILRIFSRSSDRQADQSSIKVFEDSVKSSSIPQQTMPDVNKEKLPGPDFLQKKSGTKEGQVQMIREANGNISAHQWSHLAQQWVNVGTVVNSAASSGRKQGHLGHDYDYVFDVDIEDGKPPLKLPYNLSENPYEVARKFIADNELPVSYLEQVADFINRNTQGASLGGQQPSMTSDAAAPQPRPKVLPQKTFLTITAANFPLICRKTQELNSQLLADGHKDLTLSPSELQLLPDFTKQLEAAVAQPTSSPILDTGADLAVKMVTRWPPHQRVPGLDLLRSLCAASTSLPARHDVLSVLERSGAFPSAAAPGDAANPNTTMLATRALANLFAHAPGRVLAAAQFPRIHALVAPQLRPTAGAANRNLHIAATTLYINNAVQVADPEQGFGGGGGTTEGPARAEALLGDLSTLLGNAKVVDSETIYRALVAAGTLAQIPGATAAGGFPAGQLRESAGKAAARAKEPRIRGVLEELPGGR